MADETLPGEEALYAYMRERERIRRRKEDDEIEVAQGGVPQGPPWTDDPILQTYKFTNVKRAYDRTTRALKAIYDEHRDASPEDILLNCAAYRYFGTTEMAQALGWLEIDTWDPDCVEFLARERMLAGLRVFTGAYVITNQGIKAPKEYVVTNVFLQGVVDHAAVVCRVARWHLSWMDAFIELSRLKGFGGTGFMAKEVLQDAALTPLLEDARDLETWTPFGPGARRGLTRIYGQRLNAVEMLDAARRLHRLHFDEDHWPSGFPRLTLHDIQFNLCEFDKYERVRLGEGRPRSLYKPSI